METQHPDSSHRLGSDASTEVGTDNPADAARQALESATTDSGLSTTRSVTEDSVFAYLPSDMTGPAPEPLTRFSMEHWLWLARTFPEQVPPAPVELAPFPEQVHSDAQLRSDLDSWDYLDQSGSPTAEVEEMLRAIATPALKAWGQVRFPRNTFTSHLDLPTEAMGWGLAAETTVVPRVPVLISWNPEVVYMVTSDREGLVVMAATPSTPDVDNTAVVASDLAAGLIAVVDPQHAWKVAPKRRIRLPEALLDQVAEDEVLGKSGDATTPGTSAEQTLARLRRVVGDHPSSRGYADSLRVFAELLSWRVEAFAQLVVTLGNNEGTQSITSSKAVSVILANTSAGDPGSFIAYPDTQGRDGIVAYDRFEHPALTDAFARLLRATLAGFHV